MLGLFEKTLTGNYEYFESNRENLHLPIEIKFSKKPERFCRTFFPFLGSKLNLPSSEKKRTIIGQVFLKLFSPKDVLI